MVSDALLKAELQPVWFIVSILPILRWLNKIMFTKLIKAPILLGPIITSVLEPNEIVLFVPYCHYLFCRNSVWIKKITIYNTFSMLIELINCNKINVSLHFAHFCLSHSYVYNCKTVSSFSTLACCAVSFARTLINSLLALYTFGIAIQIGTQSCDNDSFTPQSLPEMELPVSLECPSPKFQLGTLLY